MQFRKTFASKYIGACFFFFSLSALAQFGSTNGEWPSYASDVGSTKYTNLSPVSYTHLTLPTILLV